jgi:hypothetical protein
MYKKEENAPPNKKIPRNTFTESRLSSKNHDLGGSRRSGCSAPVSYGQASFSTTSIELHLCVSKIKEWHLFSYFK